MAATSSYRGSLITAAIPGGALGVQAIDGDAALYCCSKGALAVHGFVGNQAELANRWAIPIGGRANLAEWLWAAWRQQGEAMVAALRGEWAMVVVEGDRPGFAAVRDRLGLRPLHWCFSASGVAVATEVRQALAGARRRRRVDLERLAMRLATLYDDSGRTLFEGVNAVRPARVVRWPVVPPASPPASEQVYWSPPAARADRDISLDQAVETVRERITVALVRTVPHSHCALSLSGGLDSGSLWALTLAARQQGAEWAARVRPFSLVYPGQPHDESERIAAALEVGGGDGVLIDASSQALAAEFDEVVGCLDYLAMPTLIHLKLTAQAAQTDGRRVILTGMGGNEWLAGNLIYLAELLRAGRLWTCVRDILRLELPPGRRRWGLVRATIARAVRAPRARPRGLVPWVHRRWHYLAARTDLLVGGGGRRFRSNYERMVENVRFYHAGSLLALEQYAAVQGVEVRHPLCDGDLMDACFALPSRLFAGGRRPRELHRMAAGPLLPPAVRDRLAQTTFDSWCSDALRGVLAQLPGAAVGWESVRLGVVSAPWLDNELGRWYNKATRGSALGVIVLAEGLLRMGTASCVGTGDLEKGGRTVNKEESKKRRVYLPPTVVARRLEEIVRGEEGSAPDDYGAATESP